MIIFYNKSTGSIIGTIDGRVNTREQLAVNMTISGINNDQVGKIVCTWKLIGYIEGADGKKIATFEPDHNQKEVFMLFDKNPSSIYEYRVDTKTGSIVKK